MTCSKEEGVDVSLCCGSGAADTSKNGLVKGVGVGLELFLAIDKCLRELWVINVMGKDPELNAFGIASDK